MILQQPHLQPFNEFVESLILAAADQLDGSQQEISITTYDGIREDVLMKGRVTDAQHRVLKIASSRLKVPLPDCLLPQAKVNLDRSGLDFDDLFEPIRKHLQAQDERIRKLEAKQ
jgi:hypothetical protein